MAKAPLTKDRIVAAAIDILDTEGEAALTFRALAARLATGSGAIYWHVANKDELFAAATEAVIAGEVPGDAAPRARIRAIASGLFDAIDAHPWVGTQLAREPWQPAIVWIFERIGSQLDSLSVPQHAQFDSASALLSYIMGLAAQYAAGARLLMSGVTDRSTYLETLAEQWGERDPEDYPFVHRVSAQLREHDDREQFLAGIELILDGIEQVR